MTQKPKILHFLHISPPHPLVFKNNLRQFKGLPQATFHVLVPKVYVVTGAHYVTKSKIPLFA